MIRYEFGIKMPSLNDLINKCRTHKQAGAAFKRAIEEELCWQIKQQGVKKVKKGPVTANVTWYEKDRRRDKDNVISSQKYIWDSLVRMKVLPNDNWEWIDQINTKVHLSDNHKYRVVVEIIEPQEIK